MSKAKVKSMRQRPKRQWRTTTEAKRDEVREALKEALPKSSQGTSVVEAQQHIVTAVGEGGTHCPCCGQQATARREPLSKTQVRMLYALLLDHRRTGHEWLDLSKSTKFNKLRHRGEVPRMRHWGLVEQNDGGLVRVTPLGSVWLAGKTTVHKYVFLYKGERLAFDDDVVHASNVDKTFTEQGGVSAVMNWRAGDDDEPLF